MTVAIVTHSSQAVETSVTIDFRAAAENGSRREILHCRNEVERAAEAGLALNVLWPRDKQLPIVAHFLQISLLSFLSATCEREHVRATIHTRGTQVREFMHVPPSDQIAIVTYLNSEEAAMRWECDEPLPSRRLAAALRIMEAGWNVDWVIGGVRLFPGWQEDYVDILQQLTDAGVTNIRIMFAGDTSLPFEESKGRQHVVPVVSRSGVRFTVADRQRREVETFFSSALARAA